MDRQGIFILILGHPHAGKTTLVKKWGEEFGWTYYIPDEEEDTDKSYRDRYLDAVDRWDKEGVFITEGVLPSRGFRRNLLISLPVDIKKICMMLTGGIPEMGDDRKFMLPTTEEGFDEVFHITRYI